VKTKNTRAAILPPDFPLSHLRKKSIWREANRFGFLGILKDGERAAYLVSHRFWRNNAMADEGIVTIYRYGKVRGYLVNADIWDTFVAVFRGVAPRWRSRLPKLAAQLSRRYEQEARTLT